MARRPPNAPWKPTAAARKREVPTKRTSADPVPDDLRLTFARNLKAARQASGLSQGQLSKLAGVSRYYISQIETGVANVTLDMVTILAGVFGLRPGELLQAAPRGRKKS